MRGDAGFECQLFMDEDEDEAPDCQVIRQAELAENDTFHDRV